MGSGRARIALVAVLFILSACGREGWRSAAPATTQPPVAEATVAPSPSATPTATPRPTGTVAVMPTAAPGATPSRTFSPLSGCDASVAAFPTGLGGNPTSLARGDDGATWFANGNVVGHMTPSGEVHSFRLPKDVRSFSIANGFDGEMWFTDQGTTAIGRISPSGKVQMFPTPTREGNPIGIGGDANPFSITKGPDGAMWFTESAADRIGRIDPQGSITEYKLPSYDRVHANPQGIVLGPDDRLWFVQPLDETVAAFDPKTKRFSEYDLPVKDAFPSDITSALGVLFIADPNNGIIRMKPDGSATVASLPTPDQEVWQVGVSGNQAWYLETKRGTVGKISHDGKPYTVATIGKGRLGIEAHPSIGAGPDGTWFVQS